MKIITNEELKENFISYIYDGTLKYLFEGNPYRYNMLPNFYLKNKKLIDKLFDEFCNLEINCIDGLNEKQLYVLRKSLGLFNSGCTQTFKDVGISIGQNAGLVRQTFNCGYRQIHSYVCKSVGDLQITEDDMQNAEIKDMLDSSILGLFDNRTQEILCRRMTTLRELTQKSSYDLLEIRNFGTTSLEDVIKNLKKYNLSLADDIAVGKENITKSDVIRALIYKFEIEDQDYKYVKQMVDKLYDLRDYQVLPLSSENTFIIRKICGILDGGAKQSIAEISSCLKCSNKDASRYIESAFDNLRSYFKKYIYSEIFQLSKDEILKMDLKNFNLDESSYNSFIYNNICTLSDLIDYKKREDTSKKYLYYDRDLVQYLLDLVEEKELTKEQLEEKKRKRREEQAKQEEERLEKIAFTEKRKNELLKARSVLLAQKEELVKRMRYYNNELYSVEVKIKKLDNE